MADTKIVETIKKLNEGSKKRNFSQSFDLIVNLKNIDVKKPEGKVNEIVELPNGRGKEASIAIFGDDVKSDCKTISTAEMDNLAKDKRGLRKLVNSVDFFMAEAKIMPIVGKSLGMTLAPRGRMPTIIVGDADAMANRFKKSTRVRIKDAPVIQCIVGTDSMPEEKIAENIDTVLRFLEKRLPKSRDNIKNVSIKLTMSKPVKIEL